MYRPMQSEGSLIQKAFTQYHQTGFVEIQDLLPVSVCEELNVVLTKQLSTSFFDETGFGWLGQNAVQHLPLFTEVLLQHKIPQYAAQILNIDEVLLFQDLIIWKPPQSKRQVEWHQDYSYWPVDQPKGLTLWIALDESNELEGTIRYIPRSHQWGECQPTIYTLESSHAQPSDLPPLQWKQYESEAQFVNVNRGSAIAHHPLICHMSPINRSSHHRRAWSITFMCPSVGWAPEHAPHPLNHQLLLPSKAALKHGNFPSFSVQ